MTAGTKPIDNKLPSAAAANPGDPEARPSWKKIALFAAGVGVLLTVVYVSPLRDYLSRLREVSEQVRSFGALAPLVLTIGVAALVAVGFPRGLFCVIAGMALGFWSGLFWAQLGTLAGNYLVFLLVRSVGRDWAEGFLTRRGRLQAFIKFRGLLGVILARQLPLPGLVINVACALPHIRHRDYLLGTVVGQLPQAIPFTLIGAGALQPSFKRSIGLIGLAVIASILAWLGVRYALRRTSGTAISKN